MVGNTIDSRVPSRENSVLRYMLERNVKERGDKIFLKTPEGELISYSDFQNAVMKIAAGLVAVGVKQGDMVAMWMPNSTLGIKVWFAINWLGGIYVPINTAYKGNLLSHVLNNCKAKILVAQGEWVGLLSDLDLPELDTVIAMGDATPHSIDGVAIISASILDADPETLPQLSKPIEPWDVQSIIYTSGTTGPSKGVVSSYAHLAAMSGREALPMLDGDDQVLVLGPLFHVSGTMPVYAMLLRQSTAILVSAFRTSHFWSDVGSTGATAAFLLGAMATFLSKAPPAPGDRGHGLQKVILVPLLDDWREFADRFGVAAYTVFNMSETAMPIVSKESPSAKGTCGFPRLGTEARIVDDCDCEVPVGEKGELILRVDAPWSMSSGYLNNPEATLAAWRNGWFHTGDSFKKDAEGNFFFVDRLKDAIRRRGENISSFEVETEILMHPAVRECAVVAVPSENSEDEVLAIVAVREGCVFDPVQFHGFLADRLAYFMLPRYIRTMDELPRTPTEKIEKYVLRSQGVTSDCWDREVAGIKVRRSKTP